MSKMKTIRLWSAPQHELGSPPHMQHSEYKYFQVALLNKSRNLGRVTHCPDVLGQGIESTNDQILFL